jgi:hypothetical protein
MSSRFVRVSAILLSASVAGIWACGDSPVDGGGQPEPPAPRPTTISVVSGGSQTGTVGQALPSDVVVRVDDQNGAAMANRAVAFAVVSGGGSVDPFADTTDASGNASVSWTMGTATGAQQLRATVTTASGLNATVDATATADVADSVDVAHGDNQVGIVSAALSDSVVVKVFDQYGNAVPNYGVTFAVGSGGTGSVNPTSTTTDAAGEAWTRWTLGPEIAVQTVDVDAGGIKNDPLSFSAQGTDLTVTQIAPDPIVEGQSATITGTGFSGTLTNNTVLVKGIAGTVTASTTTTITFTVPALDCQPAQDVSVQVFVSGLPSVPTSHAMTPASFVNVQVGEMLRVEDPNDFCFQLAASGTAEEYLVGVQAVGETMDRLTAIAVTGTKDPAAPAPPAMLPSLFAVPQLGSDPLSRETARTRRWAAHRQAEAELRAMERRLLPTPPRGRVMRVAGSGPYRVPPTVTVGDTLPFKVPDLDSDDFCDNFFDITTVVRVVGTKGIWLEDVANPTPGYSVADFQSLSDQLDDPIYDKDVEFFGAPSDLDANSRIVVVVSERVNERGTTLGFVVSSDLFPNAAQPTGCPSSNEAEVYYAKAPDPTGSACPGCTEYPVDQAIVDAPFLIAHEFAHIIQFGRRIAAAATDFQSRWELEGQATFAEEVVGYAYEGRSSGQDYGLSVAFDVPNLSTVDWYASGFIDLAVYFGWQGFDSKTAAAPHECTWVGRASDGPIGPCLESRNPYGTPWTLLRWLSDHLGGTFPGGEAGVQRALIDGDIAGFANAEAELGVDMNEVLAKWAAMLYLDGRPGFVPFDPELVLPSWNLYDVYHAVVSIPGGTFQLRESLRLVPQASVFGDFSRSANVRDASNYYLLVSGASRPAVSIKARDGTNNPLPTHMQYWIVRTQ